MTAEALSTLINIVIGAFLGFLFSTLSGYFAYRFQLRREEINRKWEVDNKQREIRREIFSKWVNEAEAVIESFHSIAQRIADFQFKGIAKSYTKSYEQKFLADFEEEMRSINKRYSSILNIDDKKFGNSFNALVDLVTAEVDNLPKFVKIIRRKSFNKAQEFERVRTYLSKASQLKAQSVKRLYELVSLI